MPRLLVASFGDSWVASLEARLWAAGYAVTRVRGLAGLAALGRTQDAVAVLLAGDPDDTDAAALQAIPQRVHLPIAQIAPTEVLQRSAGLYGLAARFAWPPVEHQIEHFIAGLSRGPASAVTQESAPQASLQQMLAQARLVGASQAFVAALAVLPRIAQCGAAVLLTGETGTGKDLVARAVHYLGERRGEPFVPVNCAALPEGLFENELFGHARGAFTTAATAQAGLVAQAAGGTLFLDEIDTLGLRSQAALLRFVQDGQYRPLGAGATRAADVRIVAATNTDLEGMVAAGAFREDLYYRLNVMRLALPPLRERREDLPALAAHLLARIAESYRQPAKRLSPGALAWIAAQHWPGNVRELENWLHRRHILSDGPTIEAEAASRWPASGPQVELPASGNFRIAKQQAITRFERQFLATLIARSAGNVAAASRDAGTERRTLGRLLRKHGIDATEYRR